MDDDHPLQQTTDLGLEVYYAAPLAYLFGWISGLALLFLEKRNKYVRFHAAQAVVWFGTLTVLSTILGWIPFIGWLGAAGIAFVGMLSWFILIYRAYEDARSGVTFEIPVAGDFARKLLDAWSI